MRRIVASEFLTIDGFFAGTNGELDWLVPGDDFDPFANDLLDGSDTILYGRSTYEMMSGYWIHQQGRFADWANQAQKIVFSNTLKEAHWGDWNNARVLNGNLEQEVTALKQQSGKDMVIYGSGSIVQALSKLGLIDAYYLVVNPVVLGKGLPLFAGVDDKLNLKLIGTKTFKNGAIELRYRAEPKA